MQLPALYFLSLLLSLCLREQNVAALKKQVETKNTPTVTPPSALKRKADDDSIHRNKQAKGQLISVK